LLLDTLRTQLRLAECSSQRWQTGTAAALYQLALTLLAEHGHKYHNAHGNTDRTCKHCDTEELATAEQCYVLSVAFESTCHETKTQNYNICERYPQHLAASSSTTAMLICETTRIAHTRMLHVSDAKCIVDTIREH
jgi:hypothetical protein